MENELELAPRSTVRSPPKVASSISAVPIIFEGKEPSLPRAVHEALEDRSRGVESYPSSNPRSRELNSLSANVVNAVLLILIMILLYLSIKYVGRYFARVVRKSTTAHRAVTGPAGLTSKDMDDMVDKVLDFIRGDLTYAGEVLMADLSDGTFSSTKVHVSNLDSLKRASHSLIEHKDQTVLTRVNQMNLTVRLVLSGPIRFNLDTNNDILCELKKFSFGMKISYPLRLEDKLKFVGVQDSVATEPSCYGKGFIEASQFPLVMEYLTRMIPAHLDRYLHSEFTELADISFPKLGTVYEFLKQRKLPPLELSGLDFVEAAE